MAVWRCPHCGTPQAESSRCWVCRRSTTACATCRNFRRSVVSGLGLCGLDARRTALHGTEIRGCWAAPDPTTLDADPAPAGRRPVAVGPGTASMPSDGAPARRPRTFVPIDDLVAAAVAADSVAVAAADTAAVPVVRRAAGWSLWDDLEA